MKFITTATTKQYEAVTKAEALRNFDISCTICCNRGLHMDCDRCPVKVAHDLTISVIDSKELLEEAEKKKTIK